MDNETPAIESEVVEATPEQKPELLSRKDALEKALEVSGYGSDSRPEEPKPAPEPQQVDPEMEAPAEFSTAEKEAFKSGNIKEINRAWSRVSNNRRQELQRLQNERSRETQDNKTWKDLVDVAKPYIEARGKEGVDPRAAVMEALNFINEVKTNPREAKAAIDALTGGRMEELENKDNLTKTENSELRALQTQVQSLILEKEQVKHNNLVDHLDSAFNNLSTRKTSSGERQFPEIENTPSGIELAAKIGAWIRKPDFRETVLQRIPEATTEDFVVEAYKFLGARIAVDSQSSQPTRNQQQINRSRLAASSTPGRSASSQGSGNKGLSRRAAYAKALEDLEH